MSNLYILYVFIFFTILLNVVNFLLTYKKLTRKEIALYSYLLLTILGWFLCNAGADLIKDPVVAVLFAKLAIIFPLNLLNAVFQITRIFPQTLDTHFKGKVFLLMNFLILFLTFSFLFFLNSSYNIVSYEILVDGPIYYEPGWLYVVVFFTAVFVFFPMILASWFSKFNRYTQIQKKQVWVLFFVYLVVFSSTAVGLIFFPLQGLSQYAPTMFLSLSLLLFVTNQNLLVKGFMPNVLYDLGILSWGIVASAIATAYIFAITEYQGNLTFFSVFLITLMLLIALLASYKKVVSLLRADYYNIEEEVLRFANKTTVILEKEKVIEEIGHTLNTIFPNSKCEVILEKDNGSLLFKKLKEWWGSLSVPVITTQEIIIEQYLLGKVHEELTKHLYETFREKNLVLVIPLSTGDQVGGMITMKNLDRVLGVKEYEILNLLAENASVAISRAILYEEVEEFSKSLQVKVDEQTKELRSRMESMEEMRQRERDLLDIMGHELRTPLTIARNSIELIDIYKKNYKEKKKKIVWDSNFQKQFDHIKAAIRREMGIVETLLSATKLDAKKMDTHITEVDLVRVVDTAVLGFEKEAIRKDLKLKVEVNKNKAWVVKADSLQIQQVVDNLLSNAVKYTHKGYVKVSLQDLGDKISILVSDTGEGMKKEAVSKLGKKFFRLNQYAPSNGGNGSENGLVRPGGAGLGLYVAFGLVKLMGGSYTVESEPEKGSTFTVTFKKV